MTEPSEAFTTILNQLNVANLKKYQQTLLANAQYNLAYSKNSLKNLSQILDAKKQASAIIISAGPSLYRRQSIQKIVQSHYQGTIIAVDASYVACLRAGLIPDFVLSLDPHPTRMVRWFGDHQLADNTKNDDYFERQDLDIQFRINAAQKNKENIALVNANGCYTKGIISTSIPSNVLQRLLEAKMPLYWWNPLVDYPNQENSLTKRLYTINQLSAMNTGGNVGTAAWVFASTILKIPVVALVGMDLGYYADTPYKMTQAYPQLVAFNESDQQLEKYFIDFTFPLTHEKFYTDVTYYWYRQNFLELHQQTTNRTINCTEGGTLFGTQLSCMALEAFLNGQNFIY